MGYKDKVAETISISTAADTSTIVAAADRAAEAGKVRGTSRIRRVGEATDAALLYEIAVPVSGFRQMLIQVNIDDSPSGGLRNVNTRIAKHTTSQQKLLFLIPVSPKTVNGLKAYRRFMAALGSELS